MSDDQALNAIMRLQANDSTLGRLAAERAARIAAANRAEQAAKSIEADLAKLDGQVAASLLKQRELDRELKSIDSEIAKYETAANAAGKSSGYLAAKAVAEKLRLRRDELEMSGLEALESAEALQQKRTETLVKLDAEKKRFIDAKKSLEEWQQTGGSEEKSALADDEVALGMLPTGLADSVREAVLGGRPVFTRVKDGACGACGSELPAYVLNRPSGGLPIPCPSCLKLMLLG